MSDEQQNDDRYMRMLNGAEQMVLKYDRLRAFANSVKGGLYTQRELEQMAEEVLELTT